MAKDQPAKPHRKHDVQVVHRREKRGRRLPVGHGKDHMAQRRQHAEQHGQPHIQSPRQWPVQRPQRHDAKHHHANQRGVKHHGNRRLRPHQHAGQQVIGRGTSGTDQRQRHPRRVQPAARPRNQQHAGKPQRSTRPSHWPHLLAQQPTGKQHHGKGRKVDDRHRLAHRHHLQRKAHAQRSSRQTKPPHHHQPRPPRLPQGRPVARIQKHNQQPEVHQIARSHDQRHRVKHRQMLTHRIAQREQQHRQRHQRHALQRAVGTNTHPIILHCHRGCSLRSERHHMHPRSGSKPQASHPHRHQHRPRRNHRHPGPVQA